MLMLDPNAPEERQNEVLSNVESMIQSGGTLVGRHDWGVRRMSFEIDHRPEAAYHLFQFETEGNDLLERVDHSLKIADGVLRFRMIRLKPGSPPRQSRRRASCAPEGPAPPRPPPPPGARPGGPRPPAGPRGSPGGPPARRRPRPPTARSSRPRPRSSPPSPRGSRPRPRGSR